MFPRLRTPSTRPSGILARLVFLAACTVLTVLNGRSKERRICYEIQRCVVCFLGYVRLVRARRQSRIRLELLAACTVLPFFNEGRENLLQ